MLSRVANCLFWMSRFIERADNTARIVDTNLQLILDFRNIDDQSLVDHWMPIIESTGDEEKFFSRNPKATGQSVTEFLVFDCENPNSILSSVTQVLYVNYVINIIIISHSDHHIPNKNHIIVS